MAEQRTKGGIIIPAGIVVPQQMQRPLNRERGELIEGLGLDYEVVPLSKWADTPMWDEACRMARRVYRKANVREPSFDENTVIVQEYHGLNRLVFLFAAWGRKMGMFTWGWMYWPCVIKLPVETVKQLELAGRWPADEEAA